MVENQRFRSLSTVARKNNRDECATKQNGVCLIHTPPTRSLGCRNMRVTHQHSTFDNFYEFDEAERVKKLLVCNSSELTHATSF